MSSATLPVVPDPADINRLVADPVAAPAAVAAFVSGDPLPAGGGPADALSSTSHPLPGGDVVDPC